MERIEALIAAFGLQDHTNSLIGTPIRKGISGGQKRRVSVASQLITSPKILFLDEVRAAFSSYRTELTWFSLQVAWIRKLHLRSLTS
jgi:energy-coupling factor transporter ATP-binding protein EcfA2